MTFFSRLFNVLLPRNKAVGAVLAGCLIASMIFLTGLELTENIESMLPDHASEAAEDLGLLSKAPFLSRVLVIVEAGPDNSRESLVSAAKRIQKAAGPPWFRALSPDPEQPSPERAIEHLLDILPSLIKPEDLDKIEAMITPEAVSHSLEQAWLDLTGLQGLGMKKIIRADPLGLRFLVLEKFSFLNIFGTELTPDTSVRGVFPSPAGQSVLIVLDPEASMTDSGESAKMLEYLDSVISNSIPPGSNFHIVSGHSYAVANAQAIRKDLTVVLSVSLSGILAIFLIFVRVWQGVLVYAIPLAAMLAGTVAAALTGSMVSGITIGFGAVLMGLSVDYGLHVLYAMKRGASPGRALDLVSRPVLFCWLTTSGVFSLLLLSGIPGQRQLAVFTVAGLTAAMILALTVLPVFISQSGFSRTTPWLPSLRIPSAGSRIPAIAIFFALLLGALLCWPQVRFEGRLQALSMVPDQLAKAEEKIADSWGDVRGMAMVFSRGHDLNSALSQAWAVFEYLEARLPDERIVSPAPLIPPAVRQENSIELWSEFWSSRSPALKDAIVSQGRDLGFASEAFEPFFEYLDTRPAKHTVDNLKTMGLDGLTDMLILKDEDEAAVITLVPDSPAILSLLGRHQDGLPEGMQDSRLVSQKLLAQEIASALRTDMSRFLILAGVLVVALVSLLFRRAGQAFRALVPALSGLAALIVAAAVLGMEFNLYSMAATFLVLGLGVDYGIFMTSGASHREDLGTRQAVLVSGLTTMAGFGALILADHPALHSIGLTVLLGIAAAIPAALFVIPAFGEDKDFYAHRAD